MSIIITDGTGYAEKELLDNWAAEYAKRELNKHREEYIIDHPDNSISGEKIIDGAISNAKLASNAVASKNIQSGAITSDKIGSGAVTTEKLAGDAVTADKLADNAVATANIQVHAVTTDRLAYKSVTTNELGDKVVTTRTLADKCVTNYQMADNAVETYAIKDKAVTTNKIADKTITNDKIANDTIKSFNLAPNAVQTNKIEDGAVTAEKLGQGAVDTRTIADAAVTADKLSEKYIKAKESTVLDQEFPDGDYSTIIYRIEDSYEDPNKGLTETCSHYILSGVKDDEYVWEKILTGTISSENTSFCGYSTTPVRIGTWVDGTPVWRKAFDTTLTELDISDGVWGLPQLISGSGQRTKLKAIINSYVFTYPNNDYYSAIRMKEEEDGTCCRADSFCILTSRSKAGDIVRGYVDFVAEEDDVDFS